jgi:hypothetical protein
MPATIAYEIAAPRLPCEAAVRRKRHAVARRCSVGRRGIDGAGRLLADRWLSRRAATGWATAALAIASIESRSCPCALGRFAQHADCSFEELGLAVYEPGGLLKRAPGSLQRFRLPAQHRPALLEQVKDHVDRREKVTRQLRLKSAFALDHLLHKLQLALHRLEQLTRKLCAAARRRCGGDHGIHQLPPFA